MTPFAPVVAVTMHDRLLYFLGGILAFLVVASALSYGLAAKNGRTATIDNLVARINAWWAMFLIVGTALLLGRVATIVVFALLSFWALREFVTITRSRPEDHRALLYVFFVILPAQYLLVGFDWYGFFAVMIPVYAFLFVPARMVLAGQTEDFLERAASVQWGLMTCVYCVSYVPALFMLDASEVGGGYAAHALLLLWLVVVVQISDVCQYVCGKLLGRRQVAPTVSPNKTWEGLLGGGTLAVAIGSALWWATPFSPLEAAGFAAVLVAAGFLGGLVSSAIKRDRGIKDFGTLISGHGGVLDRLDSLIFAAPVFFHLVRFSF
jgi:phosphatidate cytidylyltransferase